MEELEHGKLLRIFIGEDDQRNGRPLYEVIVRTLRDHGLAGATVFRGIMGFGESSVVHTSSVLRLSEDLPIVIECVDRADRIDEVVPIVDELVGGGLVTVEKARIILSRGHPPT